MKPWRGGGPGPDPGRAGRRCCLLGTLAVLVRPWPAVAARPVTCPLPAFESTILQLLRRDADRSGRDWTGLMQDLRRMGLRSLILQWSSIGALDFFAGRPGAAEVAPVLPAVLRAAHEAGLRSWIGLHQNSAWWDSANVADDALEAHLSALAAAVEARLPALCAAAASVPPRAIAGWYVSDELDDGTWKAPGREAALTRYLGRVRSGLARAAPGRPAAISAFANHVQEPGEFGAQLSRVSRASGIDRLLLQDGIGAGKSTPEQARTTLQAVAAAFHGSGVRLGAVVELFDLPAAGAGQDPATVPAPLPAMLQRLAASAGAGDLPPTSFSHAHHLSAFGGVAAAATAAEWRRIAPPPACTPEPAPRPGARQPPRRK